MSGEIFRILMDERMKKMKTPCGREGFKTVLKNIDELFKIMASIYGHQWVSSYETNEARDLWASGLMDLDEKQIAIGIKYCIDNDIEFVPNLPRFRSFCLSEDKKRSRGVLPLLSKQKLDRD